MKTKIILFIVVVSTYCISCEKVDDFSKISKDYHYQGSVSSIIGHTAMSLDKFGVDLPPLWNVFPDYLLDMDTLNLKSVMDCNLTDTAQVKNKIAQIHLYIDVENEFPSEISAVVTLAGQGQVPISTLVPVNPIRIAAAKVDAALVKEKGLGTVEFLIKREDINQWTDVMYLVINMKLINTKKLPFNDYRYFSGYKLGLEVRAQIDFDFNVKDIPGI